MIYAIYIMITLAVNIILAVAFNSSLNISFIPVLFAVFMIFISIYQQHNRHKGDFNINNFSDLSEKEWENVSVYISRSFIIFTPFNFPLIFFFNIYVKIIITVCIVILAFIGGPIIYKIKNR